MTFPISNMSYTISNLIRRYPIFCNSTIIRCLSERKINSNETKPQKYDPNKVPKEDLIFDRPWTEDKDYFRTLRVFYTESNNVEVSRWLQSNIDLSPSAMINWFRKKSKEKDLLMQGYIPERNQILGNELAAAHFVVYRGGAVKFHGEDKWIKADKFGDYALPDTFVKNKYIEAIDCSDMTLYYEGLQNFRKLARLNWLSLNGCENMDNWCLDSICGMCYKSLVYLDLRDCKHIDELGLVALWKMEKLKILYLDDVLRSTAYEMTVLMLQEYLPDLEIKVGDFAHLE